MKSSFCKRLPTFAFGLSLGIAFAFVYLRERHAAGELRTLVDYQADLSPVASLKTTQVLLHLEKDWILSEHYPSSMSLVKIERGRGIAVKAWQITQPTEKIELPILSEGNFGFRFDITLCNANGIGQQCKAQTQYYKFSSIQDVQRNNIEIQLAPKD